MTIIKEMTEYGLRKFGLLNGLIIALLFGLLLPWLRHATFPVWPWIITVFLWLLALLIPKRLNTFYRLWMRVGLALGWVNTRIILGLVYYLMLTPIAFIMRAVGRDPLSRRIDKGASTYRNTHPKHTTQNMEVPF